MAYVKIIYQNSPSTATPINAENLNHMDDQIALNDQRLTEIETSYAKSFNGRKGDVTAQSGDYNINQIIPTSGATVGQIPVVRNDGTEEEPNLTFHMEDVPSSGHVIKDQSGTSLAQEDAMQFADAFVSDDSVNGKTVVENIKEVLPADYDSTTDEGIIVCDNGEDAVIHPSSDDYVEVEADGDTTYATYLNYIFTQIDFTKISRDSTLVIGDYTYIHHNTNGTSSVSFTANDVFSSQINDAKIVVSSSSIYRSAVVNSNGTVSIDSNVGAEKPSAHTKITLYYGNKKAVVDLQTTANRCLLNSGQTVEDAITWKSLSEVSDTNPHDLPIASEYLFIAKYGNIRISIHVLYAELTSSAAYWASEATPTAYAVITADKNSYTFVECVVENAQQIGNGATLKCYYR